jgi:O-antigen ligase
MPDIVTNSSASAEASSRLRRIDLRAVTWFSLLVLLGGLATVYPIFALECLAAVATLGCCWLAAVRLRRAGMELWQMLLLIAVSGYMLLNYGFENLAFHVGGFPIIISYGMMYASLALAVFSRRQWIARVAKEPAVLCMLALVGLTFLHFVVDLPSYGLWAIRDATMCLDGLFMLLGLFWAMKANSVSFLSKWLLVVFVLNMFYSFTLPWGEKIWSWSPESGVFLKVPLLGNYNGAGDLLLAGAVFCICVGSYVVRRPSWLMLALALGQFLGIAITQVRRMYIATILVLIILVLLGEAKKFGKLLVLLPAAVLVIVLATSFLGVEISGRIGPVNLAFFKDHIRSISGAEDTPGSDPQSRVIMGREAFQHFLAHPLFGEGFGQPLTSIIDMTNGAVTRMPHNSSISYLARLGLVGFAFWIAFHFCLLSRFIHALRQRRYCDDKRVSAFVLWAFLFYVLFMIGSFVEAPFEFPSGAVPFYFLMGFALGVMRWHMSGKNKGEYRAAAFASSAKQSYL